MKSDGFLWQFGRLRQANSHSYWREANGQNDQKDTDRTQTGTKFRLMDNLGLTSTTRIATPAPTGQIVKESALAAFGQWVLWAAYLVASSGIWRQTC